MFSDRVIFGHSSTLRVSSIDMVSSCRFALRVLVSRHLERKKLSCEIVFRVENFVAKRVLQGNKRGNQVCYTKEAFLARCRSPRINFAEVSGTYIYDRLPVHHVSWRFRSSGHVVSDIVLQDILQSIDYDGKCTGTHNSPKLYPQCLAYG